MIPETPLTNECNPGSSRSGGLDFCLVARISRIHLELEEVCPRSMEKWLEAFAQDANPEREILWWERLTRYYCRYRDKRPLTAEQRQALFRVVFKLGMGLNSQALVSDVAQLPAGALEEILALLHGVT